MFLLNTTTITTAVAATTTPPLKFIGYQSTKNLTVQVNFAVGTGGITVDAYVQTTFDGGATWTDIANFHFANTPARKIINLSSMTPVTTQVAPSDGSMTANTAQDGLIGSMIRLKWVTTGTYSGGTTLQVVALSNSQLSTN